MTGQRPRGTTRRTWLRALGATALLARAGVGAAGDDAVERIRAKGRDARMQPFDESESARYVAVGDASAGYRGEALRLCEAFGADFLAYFQEKGFALAWPAARLPIVVLAGPTSYAAFEKGFADEAIGGHFDLDANWLVTFDYRPLANAPRARGGPDPRVVNTFTLVHEAAHQLAYNTGLLDRGADVPLCVVEGLATYAETWGPTRRSGLGAPNVERRRGLATAQAGNARWIPVRRLLAEDNLVNDEATRDVAYAISTLLVAKLLKDPARLPHFRDYLKAVRATKDPARRVALAEEHLGDLDKLDREIRR